MLCDSIIAYRILCIYLYDYDQLPDIFINDFLNLSNGLWSTNKEITEF